MNLKCLKLAGLFLLISLGLVLAGCSKSSKEQDPSAKIVDQGEASTNLNAGPNRLPPRLQSEDKKMQNLQELYFAGGCFWGVESYFQRIAGVEATEVGYANGKTEDTEYRRLAETEHAETVKIVFDRNRIHPAELIYHLFRIIDPTSLDRQGNDIGRQYRSGIYAKDQKLLDLAEAMLEHLQSKYDEQLQVEVQPLANYIPAEEYHQDYLSKNPSGYCHINTAIAYEPLIKSLSYPKRDQSTMIEELKEDDTAAYKIMLEADTEAPFSSELNQQQAKGIYVDRISGEPLFSSTEKYESGCGWPSFTRSILTQTITYHEDLSFGRQRVETKSLESDAHLGHVFDDGPQAEGGLRFCINGAALDFIPLEEMAERGYADFTFFVEY
ncbi:MAG: peptide-methionine (R)-S-oxide reductase MsrB [Eubacteriales bacterium]|nr:peptide-methionine (R)-S-oxide reductase MsrB [Eubacteriales bacterium]